MTTLASISFTDALGVVSVTNTLPEPGDRFANWTPDAMAIGPAAVGLGNGLIYQWPFRDDYLVSLELPAIPNTEFDKLLRLQTHLLDGYLVAVACENVMASTFAICGLAPETVPEIEMTDSTNLEYTFRVRLLGLNPADIDAIPADEPFYPPGCASHLSGIQAFGDSYCRYGPGDYAQYRIDQMTDTDRYLTVHPASTAFAEFGVYDLQIDQEGQDGSEDHIDFVDSTAFGISRMLKFTRLSTDTPGRDWGAEMFLSAGQIPPGYSNTVPTWSNYFQRIVCEFSENFELHTADTGDPGDDPNIAESDFMQLMVSKYVAVQLWQPHGLILYMDKVFLAGGYDYSNPPVIDSFANFFSGTPKEIIIRVRDTGTTAVIDVWYGDAGSALARPFPAFVYTYTGNLGEFTFGGGAAQPIVGKQFYIWLNNEGTWQSVPATGSEYYGLIEWEGGDATNIEDASWFSRLAT